MNKILVVYYSYSNNTKKIVDIIKEYKDIDIIKLQPVIPYTDNYQELVDNEESKMNDKNIIEIKNFDLNLDNYDKIIIGTPVWWYTITPVVRSFLNKYNLKNKEVEAFITNGGWIGHTVKEFNEYVDLKDYIDIKFNGSELDTNKEKIIEWINNL